MAQSEELWIQIRPKLAWKKALGLKGLVLKSKKIKEKIMLQNVLTDCTHFLLYVYLCKHVSKCVCVYVVCVYA